MIIRIVSLFVLGALQSQASAYDPLTLAPSQKISTQDVTVHDKTRNRDIPLRIYLPVNSKPAPVVLFSHGLGGSRENNAYLGQHWSGRGYVAVFLQHVGSDESVWKESGRLQGMKDLKAAANTQNYLLRTEDVPAVLNQLELWNKTEDHFLAGRLNLSQVGMSGHSFGAVTTQAVSGQKGLKDFTDPRIKAAIAFSPNVPAAGDPKRAFGSVSIPWLLMTGTEDSSTLGNATPKSRQEVYPALPPGNKYELVLFGAEHSAFGDRALPGEKGGRNPNHHRIILALSTAFWDAYLRVDKEAKAWLDGPGSASILDAQDRWQRK